MSDILTLNETKNTIDVLYKGKVALTFRRVISHWSMNSQRVEAEELIAHIIDSKNLNSSLTKYRLYALLIKKLMFLFRGYVTYNEI